MDVMVLVYCCYAAVIDHNGSWSLSWLVVCGGWFILGGWVGVGGRTESGAKVDSKGVRMGERVDRREGKKMGPKWKVIGP